jgi:hypothetical protein
MVMRMTNINKQQSTKNMWEQREEEKERRCDLGECGGSTFYWGVNRCKEYDTSEVQNKMIFMGHQISPCHVLVVRSFFILWKMLLSLKIFHMITF